MADLEIFEPVRVDASRDAWRDLFDWIGRAERNLLYSSKYEARSQWGPSLLSRPADTVPGQPQPGVTDASEKTQAPSCPLDLVVDPRNVE